MDRSKINYLLDGEILVKGKTFGLWQPKKYLIDQEQKLFSIKSSNPKKKNKNYFLQNYQIANIERKNNRFQFELLSQIGGKNILMGSDNEKFANELMQFIKKLCGYQPRTQSLFEPSIKQSLQSYDYEIPQFFEIQQIREAIQQIRTKQYSLENFELIQNQVVKIYRNKSNQQNFKVFITFPGNYVTKCFDQLFKSQYEWNQHNLKEYTQIKEFKQEKYQMVTEVRLIKNWFQFKREFTYLRNCVELQKKESLKLVIEKKAEHKLHQTMVSGQLKYAVWGILYENNETKVILFTEQNYSGLSFVEEDSMLSQQYFMQLENLIRHQINQENEKFKSQMMQSPLIPNNSPTFDSSKNLKQTQEKPKVESNKIVEIQKVEQPIVAQQQQQSVIQFQPIVVQQQPKSNLTSPQLIANQQQNIIISPQQINNNKDRSVSPMVLKQEEKNNFVELDLKKQSSTQDNKSQESFQNQGNTIAQNIIFNQPQVEDVENEDNIQEHDGSEGNNTEFYDCEDDIDAMNDKLYFGQGDEKSNNNDESIMEVRNSITVRQMKILENPKIENNCQSDDIENLEAWVEKKMSLYLNGTYVQIAIDIKHFLEPLELDLKNRKYMKEQEGGHYIFRKDFVRDEKSGGLKCINEAKISAQKSVVKFLLARIGTSLLMGKSLTSISMPVSIFESRSNTERACSSLAFGPVFLEDAALSQDKYYRIKQCAAFSFGFIFSYLSMEKPFNPILGETFQGYFDNCPIYCEQISHHPPICIIQFFGRKYKIDARLELIANFHSNSVVGKNVGEVKIIFENPHQEVIVLLAPGCIYGTTFGDKSMDFLEKQFLLDLNNKIIMECAFKPDKKYCQYFNCEYLNYSDYVVGGVCEVTDSAINRYLREGYRKYKGLDLKTEVKSIKNIVKGIWNKELKIDNQQLISIMTDFPIKLQLAQYPLPSDANFRMDVLMWKLRDFDQAQSWKEKLEILQRQDRKLREALGPKKQKR